jgi:hypothetical protein
VLRSDAVVPTSPSTVGTVAGDGIVPTQCLRRSRVLQPEYRAAAAARPNSRPHGDRQQAGERAPGERGRVGFSSRRRTRARIEDHRDGQATHGRGEALDAPADAPWPATTQLLIRSGFAAPCLSFDDLVVSGWTGWRRGASPWRRTEPSHPRGGSPTGRDRRAAPAAPRCSRTRRRPRMRPETSAVARLPIRVSESSALFADRCWCRR